ncbi:coiled-coil domain-containing protein 61-like [Notechis scutatus]|uniref:Coiled-coil domain-containing protein 61-like n=1 Tax=Notechis scutatus TaxID=8663 RepID=A0A6J1VQD5_9SAUR|nr:coiled-coil domain-containing protein 61-like [Notechis scutatus]
MGRLFNQRARHQQSEGRGFARGHVEQNVSRYLRSDTSAISPLGVAPSNGFCPCSFRGRKRLARNRKPFSSSSWNGPTAGPRADNAHKKRFSSTPHTGKARGKGKAEEILENSENLYDEPSADLSEIDARLQALQEYMNKLETQT